MMAVMTMLPDLMRSLATRMRDSTSVVLHPLCCLQPGSRGAACGNNWGAPEWRYAETRALFFSSWQSSLPLRNCGRQRGASEKRWVRVASGMQMLMSEMGTSPGREGLAFNKAHIRLCVRCSTVR